MTTEFTKSRALQAELVAAVSAGASVPVAAARLGCTDRTVYRVARRDSEFRAALSAALTERDADREYVDHGTITRYTNHRCRCVLCREVNRQRAARDRRIRYSKPVPASVPHGQASTYSNWGCRCEPCTKANTAYNAPYVRAWAERQRAAKAAAS